MSIPNSRVVRITTYELLLNYYFQGQGQGQGHLILCAGDIARGSFLQASHPEGTRHSSPVKRQAILLPKMIKNEGLNSGRGRNYYLIITAAAVLINAAVGLTIRAAAVIK